MTNGYLACTFDLLNVGDLDVIAQARRQCDHLTVGVYSDEFVELRSGRSTVVPLRDRMALLEHVRGVDAVVIHDESRRERIAQTYRYFLIADDPSEIGCTVAVRLSPARRTVSREIRDALAPSAEAGAA